MKGAFREDWRKVAKQLRPAVEGRNTLWTECHFWQTLIYCCLRGLGSPLTILFLWHVVEAFSTCIKIQAFVSLGGWAEINIDWELMKTNIDWEFTTASWDYLSRFFLRFYFSSDLSTRRLGLKLTILSSRVTCFMDQTSQAASVATESFIFLANL